MKPVLGDNPHQVFDRVPFTALLGLQRVYSSGGRAQLRLPARPELGNVIGGVHGGAVAALLDVAMASAAMSMQDFRWTVVTLAMETQFLQPGHGDLLGDSELLHQADGVAQCRAEVSDTQGRCVARALGSFRCVPRPGADTASA
jgi:uncharacterized protein (TIGR00369 family)